jgi:hypothetical protein
MAVDIGTLRINLVTNTASFNGPLDKATQQARNAAQSIQRGFNEIDLSEARGGIIVLGEEIGIHLPRHVQSFIATLPGVGAAMSAAFPVLAVIAIGVAIVEAAEKLAKFREEAEKAVNDQTKLGTAIHEAFNSLDEKLLQAGIRADELKNNHLAALKKQLELINAQSMSELAHSFDVIAKAADVAFQDLKSHWYTFGIGSDGAKHALSQFQTQYESLLAQGKNKEASDLLAGTLQSAQRILAFQKQYIANQMNANTGKGGDGNLNPDYYKFEEAALELKKAGLGVTDKEIQAQQALVDTLNAQVQVQAKVEALKKAQSSNARTDTSIHIGDDAQKKNEQQLQEDLARLEALKAAAVETYTAMGMSIDQARAKADQMFSAAELQAHLDFYNKQEAAAVKVNDKQKINAERNIFLDRELAKANDERARTEAKNTESIAKLNEQSFKQSQEINAETQKNLMATATEKVRAMIQRINLTRTETDEEASLAALQQVHAFQRIKDIQTEIKALQDLRKERVKNGQDTTAVDAAIHNAQVRKLQDYQSELLATNKLGSAFKALGLQMQIEAQQTAQKIFQALNQTLQGLNTNLAQFIVEGKADWRQLAASAIESFIEIGLQYAETRATMAILDALGLGEKKTKNAAEAHSSANAAAANTLADVPFPANIGAAAGVLAFGEGLAADALALHGAVLPNREMLVHTHPEEMILPQNISNFIVRAAGASGEAGAGLTSHMVFAPTIHAVDAQGVDRVLTKHIDVFTRRMSNEMRRRNMRF